MYANAWRALIARYRARAASRDFFFQHPPLPRPARGVSKDFNRPFPRLPEGPRGLRTRNAEARGWRGEGRKEPVGLGFRFRVQSRLGDLRARATLALSGQLLLSIAAPRFPFSWRDLPHILAPSALPRGAQLRVRIPKGVYLRFLEALCSLL